MPLHIICECCKCKKNQFKFDIWSISRNHKHYSESRYVCSHFDVEIDHESSIGFFGLGWSNHIKIYATYKSNYERKNIIDYVFRSNDTEEQAYQIFSNKIVFRARVSDSKNNDPTCGADIQERMDYNEIEEKQKLEQKRRQEEENKRKQIEADIDNIIEKNKIYDDIKDILMSLENICNEISTTSVLILEDITKERSIRETFHNYKEVEMIKTY